MIATRFLGTVYQSRTSAESHPSAAQLRGSALSGANVTEPACLAHARDTAQQRISLEAPSAANSASRLNR